MEKNIFYNGNILDKNKLRESWLETHHIEIYKIVKEFQIKNNLFDIKFSNLLYCYINNINEIPICEVCHEKNKRYVGFDIGYNNFCSKKCASKYSLNDALIKRKEKTIEKYGVNHTSQLESVKNKQKLTNIKKYGFISPTQNEHIHEKQKLTMMCKYGVNYTGNSDELMSKVFNTRFNKYKKLIKDTYKYLNIINIPKKGTLLIKCHICFKEYEIKTSLLRLRYFRYKTNPCLFCNPNESYKYTGQNEIYEFLNSYKLNIIRNDRNILNRKEIDIYLPEKKLAIEFNGLYWHSTVYKEKSYHIDKKNKCFDQNINLIHIWEDDWLYKQDIVKSRLLNLCGLTKNKIYARNCNIINLSDYESKIFLNKNHLQGYIPSSYKIGLVYNNELVSVMTFGKFRRSLGQKGNEHTWELYRFCNKINFNVVGSFEKLLNNFEKNINPVKLITYANLDWVNKNKNIYEKSGFCFVKETNINYWYFDGNIKRYHRYGFRKDKLIKDGFDKNKTEKEIMFERGFYMIYDCGNLKYEKNY